MHSTTTAIVAHRASVGENAPSAAKKTNRAMMARARIQKVSRIVSSMRGTRATSLAVCVRADRSKLEPEVRGEPGRSGGGQRQRSAVGATAQPAAPQQLVEQRGAERP